MASLFKANDLFTSHDILTIIIATVSFYAVYRIIYLSYFHPLSRFPGPRIAAISNVWYAYHWLSGRYPWAITDALRKYGPVVRIAPNELVFFTPQAFTDIYAPHQKSLEIFVKTDFQNRGKNLGGIIWEEDPRLHRDVVKKLSPAFSSRFARGLEPIIHKYMDFFVIKMKEIGSSASGIPLVQWTNWLAMDLSADLAWNEKMNQMRESLYSFGYCNTDSVMALADATTSMRDAVHLDVLLSFNKFATVLQVFKRFPLMRPIQYLFAPFGKVRLYSAMENATRNSVMRRIDQRGNTDHPDYFDHILPADSPVPANDELTHIGSVALQIMFAGWGPMGDLFYGTIVLLLQEPTCYQSLVDEIRDHFADYDAITPSETTSLPYLHACLAETLRMLPSNLTGLPRLSPGAVVDGHYIPKGTHVQTCLWALGRSPTYFHDPFRFQPQRWLENDHALYDPVFAEDNLSGLHPFSLGPRICLGREMAWMQGKLFLAKLLWSFDVIMVSKQPFDLDKTLLHYGFFDKPEVNLRFIPVTRDQDHLVRNGGI